MRLTPRLLFLLGAVTLALSNLGRIPGTALGGRAAAFTVQDLLLVPLWLGLLAAWRNRRRSVVVDPPLVPALAFALVGLLSSVLAWQRYDLTVVAGIGVVAFLVRWVLYLGWYLAVTSWLSAREASEAWEFGDRAVLVMAAFGIIQSLFLPGFAQMVTFGNGPEWDQQGRRLVSTMLDPNLMGMLIVCILVPRLARASAGLRTGSLSLVLLAVALLLTVSRSAMVALAVGLLVIVAVRGVTRRMATIVVGGALLFVPMMTFVLDFARDYNKLGLDVSAIQRLVPWTRAISFISQHPLLGVGFNAIEHAQRDQGLRPTLGAEVSFDGGLLFIAAMTGVVGLTLYCVMLARMWRSWRATWRDETGPADDRAYAVGTAAITAAVLVHSFFANSLLTPFFMQLLWIRWGGSTVMARRVVASAHATLWSRLTRRVALAGAAPAATGAVVLVLLLTGCEPCAGVSGCTTERRLDVAGQIVDRATGRPVGGVTIHVAPSTAGATGGAVTTDAEGRWRVTGVATSDSVTTDVSVQGAAGGYVVRALRLPTVRGAGEATYVGLWTSRAFARALITALRRGVPAVGASVVFRRTSGVNIAPGVVQSATNGAGTFELAFDADSLGAAIGTLEVNYAGRRSVFTGYGVNAEYRYGIPRPAAALTIGGSLVYGGQVAYRGTEEKVPGATVRFVRTGGIPLLTPTITTVSADAGVFVLNLETDADTGRVIGDVTITSPDGTQRFTYRNKAFAIYDASVIPNSGAYYFGERWAWALEFWRNDKLVPVPNVRVTFERTGGLAMTPASFDLRTDSTGRIVLRSAVRDTGTVVGDLTVLADGATPRVYRGVALRTTPNDNVDFAGVYTFGPALRYVGVVQRTDGTGIPGAQVRWTQTLGPPATPAVVDLVTDATGYFPLTLLPSGTGTVFGTFRVVPPAPWAPGTIFTFANQPLATFETLDAKLGAVLRIAPP